MLGPNPFVLWGENPNSIVGRNLEIKLFNSFINGVGSKQPLILSIIGGAGIGKTLLLNRLRKESQKNAFVSPYINIDKGEDISSVVRKLHKETIYAMQDMAGSGKKFQSLSALSNELNKKQITTLSELVNITNNTLENTVAGVFFFLDDFDNLRKNKFYLKELVNILSNDKISIGFVTSSKKDLKINESLVRRFRLFPLSEHDVRELVSNALKKEPRMGEQCLKSIMNASAGNPKLVKTICWLLYDRLKDTDKLITKGHYLSALPSLMGLLGREWFGEVYTNTPESERKILNVLAEHGKAMHVSDIAKTLDQPLGPTTALIARLLESGQVVKIDRGLYKLFSRLYGRYVLDIT